MPRPQRPTTQAEDAKEISSIDGFLARYEHAPANEDAFKELGKKHHVWRCALPLSDLTSDPIEMKRNQGYEFAKDFCTNKEVVMILPIEKHRALLDKLARPFMPAPNKKAKTGNSEEEFLVEGLEIEELEPAFDLD